MASLDVLLQQSLTTHSIGVIGFAFIAGIVSSLLPCALGMLPVLVGYVAGYGGTTKAGLFLQLTLFILGIATIMTILGITASLLGLTFGSMLGSGWYYAIGVVAIIMGLQLLEIIHLPMPQVMTKLPETNFGRYATPFILGMAFGTASSPCGTPFLVAILGFISHEKNMVLGGASLFCYAVGQGMLLLVIGLFTGALKYMAVLRKVGSTLNKVSALAFLFVGAMFIAEGAGVWGSILLYFHLI